MPLTLHQQRQGDPTRTLTLRNKYAAAMKRRFGKVRADIKTSIVDNDAFGLGIRDLSFNQAAGERAFAFGTDAAKVEGFMNWLRVLVDQDILEVISASGGRITDHTRWQDAYIRTAYGKGVVDADTAMRKLGLDVPQLDLERVFDQPIHARRVELLFTRNFEELRGISQAMANQISRALSQGLVEGLGAASLAKRLTDEVDGITKRRAVALARTEVIRASAESRLTEFENLGVGSVVVEEGLEILTAGDDRVCSRCAALEGQIFTIAEARGVIPLHPA